MHEPTPIGRQPAAASGGPDPRIPAAQTRILVVEDDSLLASTVCDVLALERYACKCVTSYPAVEALLDQESFDLILADVSIPGAPTSEREYFALLRQRSAAAAIVAMTGDPKGLLVAGPDLGFDELISKPFEIDQLTRCIRTVLDGRARDVAVGE